MSELRRTNFSRKIPTYTYVDLTIQPKNTGKRPYMNTILGRKQIEANQLGLTM
jgi:hypothetical protein